MVEHIEIFVEEPSAEAALRHIVPKIIGSLSFQIYPHQGKTDLLTKLPNRLRGYASWLPASWRIVVVVDRDDDDCIALKAKLPEFAYAAGLQPRSSANPQPYAVVNRIAIEELEAWYFGDWDAVKKAYPKVPAGISRKAKYRKPDAIAGGTWEAFERVMQKVGYFTGGLRKIEAATEIGPFMNIEANTSHSFQIFRSALLEMAQPCC